MTGEMSVVALGVEQLKQVLNDTDTSTTPVSELAAQYWYNIVIIGLLVVLVIIGLFGFFYLGWKKKWHHFDEIQIDDLTQPCISLNRDGTPDTKLWIPLFAYRVVILVFCTFTWFWTLFHDSGGSLWLMMSFYTIWNFTMLICYFACVSLFTVLQRFNLAKPIVVKVLGNITLIMYNIEVALVFLVDVILWLFLFPYLYLNGNVSEVLNFSSYVEHGFNMIFMMIELGFNRLPIRLFNMTWMTVWAVVYLFWAMFYYSITLVWRYPFLNLWSPYAIFWYLIVFGMHFVFYLGCYGLYRLKLRVLVYIAKRRGAELKEHVSTNTDVEENSGYYSRG